jgi:lauroyl/myristoyl acyltransferase
VIVCGCHLSNFNLAFLALALRDVPLQVLSAAQPVGGFRIMHELRARGLLAETPIDGPALRKAIQRLRGGGIVATGVDWPVGVPADQQVLFFNRPARVPTGHIRLAIAADAVLLPIACRWTAARGYFVLSAPRLELELSGDREADIRHNARRVLAVMEQWIAETPDQWLMYHPIWPDT